MNIIRFCKTVVVIVVVVVVVVVVEVVVVPVCLTVRFARFSLVFVQFNPLPIWTASRGPGSLEKRGGGDSLITPRSFRKRSVVLAVDIPFSCHFRLEPFSVTMVEYLR